MKIVFMGTPAFAVPTLKHLVQCGYRPLLCITQPDRPQGRKRRLAPPPVKMAAQEFGIEVIQPEDVNDQPTIERLQALQPDVVVTVAYGGYLKRQIRRLPRWGCLNLHPSLLPQYRGSAPLNFALFNGDAETGVSIFRIVAAMDAGPILRMRSTPIEPGECYTHLHDRLAEMGAHEMEHALRSLEDGTAEEQPQNHDLATFSHKLLREHFLIDWQTPGAALMGQVRGLAEVPGAVAQFRGNPVKIIELHPWEGESRKTPGTVLEVIKNRGIVIAGSDGNLLITRVQPAGKKIMTAHAFHLGARIDAGEAFTNGL